MFLNHKAELTLLNYSVDLGTPVNTPILKIQASDKDEGLNGKFTYSVLKTEIFKISPETG